MYWCWISNYEKKEGGGRLIVSHFYCPNQILEFILYGLNKVLLVLWRWTGAHHEDCFTGLVPVDRGSSRGLFYWSCAGGPGLITRTVSLVLCRWTGAHHEDCFTGLVPVDQGSSWGLFYWSCASGPGLITRTVFVSVLSQDLDVMSFFLNDLK